jgi:hypothetical protein
VDLFSATDDEDVGNVCLAQNTLFVSYYYRPAGIWHSLKSKGPGLSWKLRLAINSQRKLQISLLTGASCSDLMGVPGSCCDAGSCFADNFAEGIVNWTSVEGNFAEGIVNWSFVEGVRPTVSTTSWSTTTHSSTHHKRLSLSRSRISRAGFLC